MPLSGSVWVAAAPVAIMLAASAPSGVEITLTSSDNAVAQSGGPIARAIGTSRLVIPAGSPSATFRVRTHGVTAPTTVTLRAASTPNDFGTASLTVTPATVRTLVVAPTAVATLTLDGRAPAAWRTVSLRGAGPASVPGMVTVPGSATTATFAVITTPVACLAPAREVRILRRRGDGGAWVLGEGDVARRLVAVLGVLTLALG